MSSLYRTARPRFTLYSPDGLGRDRYIIYNNGGFWKTNEYKISPKANYEYPKYNNFHTLFHMAAPFKYYSDGSGRDSYVLRDTGLRREQKPLNSYHLSDFLRNDSWDKHSRKNVFLSRAEIRDNKLRKLHERRMIKRLYSKPLQNILFKKEEENKNIKGNFNFNNSDIKYKTLSQKDFSFKNNSGNEIFNFRNQSNDNVIKMKNSCFNNLNEVKNNSKMKLHKRGKSDNINKDPLNGKYTYFGIKNNYYSSGNFRDKKVKVAKFEIDV